MGISEILLIAVVAVIFIGPDKLPKALVDFAKMFRTLKRGVNEAKDTLEKEVNMDDMRAEAAEYKKLMNETKQNVASIQNYNVNDLLEDKGTGNSEQPQPSDSAKESKDA